MTALSFETFPPKSLDASFHLWDTVQALTPLAPRFVSVTYGAGGSTRSLTQEAAQTLRKTSGLQVAAHLTCTGQTKQDVLDTAARYASPTQQNIDWLKAKIDAGAAEAITQFFFEADRFLRFRDACADAGISAPWRTDR